MIFYRIEPGNSINAGPSLTDGTDIGIDIGDTDIRLVGTVTDIERLWEAIGLALDQAAELRGLVATSRYHWSDNHNIHECDFGPGQNNSRCPRC